MQEHNINLFVPETAADEGGGAARGQWGQKGDGRELGGGVGAVCIPVCTSKTMAQGAPIPAGCYGRGSNCSEQFWGFSEAGTHVTMGRTVVGVAWGQGWGLLAGTHP